MLAVANKTLVPGSPENKTGNPVQRYRQLMQVPVLSARRIYIKRKAIRIAGQHRTSLPFVGENTRIHSMTISTETNLLQGVQGTRDLKMLKFIIYTNHSKSTIAKRTGFHYCGAKRDITILT